MSDISRIRRGSEGTPFPSIRRNSDPLQPQNAEVVFSEEMASFDNENASSVQGTDKTENLTVHEDDRRKNLEKHAAEQRESGKDNQEADGQKAAEEEKEEKIIDIEV